MWQRKYNLLFLTLLTIALMLVPRANAQMMGNFQNLPTVIPAQQDLQDIQTGQDLYNKFQNKQVTCSQLKDNDFEKIGEYIMDQRFGNANQHIQMNNNMKNMMGEQAEENMHIILGKSATGCNVNYQNKGGVSNMMSWGYPTMMSGSFGWGFGLIGFLFWSITFVDLILLGVFLWKKIQK